MNNKFLIIFLALAFLSSCTTAKKASEVSAVYVCPHRTDEKCKCRKPEPGLLLKAAEEHNIDLGNSVIIGDSDKDTEAGLKAGLKKVIKI